MRKFLLYFSIFLIITSGFSPPVFSIQTTETFSDTVNLDPIASTAAWDVVQGQARLSVETFSATATQVSENFGIIRAISVDTVPATPVVIAVGDSGNLFTYETGSANNFRRSRLSQTLPLNSTVTLYDVSAYNNGGNTEAYIVGNDAGTVYKYTYNAGTGAESLQSVGNFSDANDKYGVKASDANDIWVCGANGKIFHYDGTTETDQSPSGVSSDFYDIDVAVNGANFNGCAVGAGGIVYTFEVGTGAGNTASFLQNSLPGSPTSDFYGVSIAVNAGTEYIYVVGASGKIFKFTGSGTNSWSDISPSGYSSVTFRHVHFRDNNNGLVVGDNGIILTTSNGGSSWSEATVDFYNNLYGVYYDTTTNYVVGEDTLFGGLNGGRWQPLIIDGFNTTGGFVTGSDVYDVDMYSGTWAVLVCENGLSYGYDGTNFSFLNRSPKVSTLNSVTAYANNYAFACGAPNSSGYRVYRYDGSAGQWTVLGPTSFGSDNPFMQAIDAYDSSHAVCAGENGYVLLYDGSWTTTQLDSNTTFYGAGIVWANSSFKGTTVVGHNSSSQGRVYTYDGSTWNSEAISGAGSIPELYSVKMWGTSFGVLGGQNGFVAVYNGSQWTQATLNPTISETIYKVYIASPKEIFLTCASGRVYKYYYTSSYTLYRESGVNEMTLGSSPFQNIRGIAFEKQGLLSGDRRNAGLAVGENGLVFTLGQESYATNGWVQSKTIAKGVYRAQLMNSSTLNLNGCTIEILFTSNGTDWSKPSSLYASLAFSPTQTGTDFRWRLSFEGNATATPFADTVIISYEVDTNPPTVVSGLTHIDDAPSGYDNDLYVWFDWADSTDTETTVEGYNVSIWSDAAGTWSKIFFTKASEFTITANSSFFGANYAATDGRRFRLSVAAVDIVGNIASAELSSLVIVDTSPPTSGTIKHVEIPVPPGRDNTKDFDDDDYVYYEWSGFSDASSTIDHYAIKVYEDGTANPSGFITVASTEAGYTVEVGAGNPYGYSGDGHVYSIEVYAVDKVGLTSPVAFTVPVYVIQTPPPQITRVIHSDEVGSGITANDGYDDDSDLHFDWTMGIGTYSYSWYNVYIYRNGVKIYSQMNITDPWFTYSGAAEGYTYECRVEGAAGTGLTSAASDPSVCEDVVTDFTPPTSPTNLTVEQDTDSSNDGYDPESINYDDDGVIVFKWTEASPRDNVAFDHYTIKVSRDNGNTYTETYTTTEATFTYPASGALSTGDTVKIRVWAVDKRGLSQEATAASGNITVDTTAPPAPTNVVHDDSGNPSGYDDDSSLHFSWTAPTDTGSKIAYYLVMSREANNSTRVYSNWSAPVKRTTTEHTITAVAQKNAYQIAVKAVDMAGNVSATAESNFAVWITTGPTVPSSITHSDADTPVEGYDNDQVLDFSWTPPADLSVQTIEIYIAKSNVNNGAYPTTPSVTLGPLTPDDLMTTTAYTYTYDTGTTERIGYRIKLVYKDGLGNATTLDACPDSELVTVEVGSADLKGYRPPQPTHVDTTVADIAYDDDTAVEFQWATGGQPSSVYAYIVSYKTRDAGSSGSWSKVYTTEVKYDGADPMSWTYTGFSGSDDDKAIQISIHAVDAVYNSSLESLTSEIVTMDLLNPSPEPKFQQPSPNVVDADTITLVVTQVSSDTHLKEYQVKGGPYTTWTKFADSLAVNDNITFNLLQNRENKFEFRAVDYAGRVSATSSVTIIEDSVPPNKPGKPYVTSKYLKDKYGTIWVSSQTVEFTWSPPPDTISRYEIWREEDKSGTFQIVDPNVSSQETSYSFTVDDDKVYRIKVVAVDELNKESTSEASYYIYTDQNPPVDNTTPASLPIITTPPYTTTHETYFILKLDNFGLFTDETSNSAHATHEAIFQIQGGKLSKWTDVYPTTNAFTFELVPNSVNTLMIRVRDLAENVTDTAMIDITEESTPPPTPSPAEALYDVYYGYDIDGKVIFQWDKEEMSSTTDFDSWDVYLSINEQTFTYVANVKTYTWEVPATYIADGYTYRIKLRARDKYGNVGDLSPRSEKVTVDLTPPKIDFDKSTPKDGSFNIKVNTAIEIYFTEQMKQETFSKNNAFTVTQNGEKVQGTYLYDSTDKVLRFVPEDDLKHNKLVTISFNSETTSKPLSKSSGTIVKDLAGNSLQGKTSLSFTTVPSPGLSVNRLLNYPNPINGSVTEISYDLSEDCERVTLTIYSADGRKLFFADDLTGYEGMNYYTYDGYDRFGHLLSNGTYFYFVCAYKEGKKAQARQKFIVLR